MAEETLSAERPDLGKSDNMWGGVEPMKLLGRFTDTHGNFIGWDNTKILILFSFCCLFFLCSVLFPSSSFSPCSSSSFPNVSFLPLSWCFLLLLLCFSYPFDTSKDKTFYAWIDYLTITSYTFSKKINFLHMGKSNYDQIMCISVKSTSS